MEALDFLRCSLGLGCDSVGITLSETERPPTPGRESLASPPMLTMADGMAGCHWFCVWLWLL